jgi:hypothetical protein
MYSWEIDNYLKERNYVLDRSEEMLMLEKGSTQITKFSYEGCNKDFLHYRIETNDNYQWNFSLRRAYLCERAYLHH